MALLQQLRLALSLSALCLTPALAQWIYPSNNSADLSPIATSPRCFINGSELGSIPSIKLAPLQPYVQGITKSNFLTLNQPGQLIGLDAANINQLQLNQFGYLSCDPDAYTGYLNASDVFNVAFNSGTAYILILYSEHSNHCNLAGINVGNENNVQAVFTTVDPTVASMVAKLDLNSNSKGFVTLLPDLSSFTNSSGGGTPWDGGSILGPSPTTAVAMIILYSITGIITSLFVLIIITGAIRAHRHPERYGPRHIIGRSRQSRAKGIARAMLETLPIVKFGDHDDVPAAKATDIEMNAADKTKEVAPAVETDTTTQTGTAMTAKDNSSSESLAHSHNADGTQADGSLGCSICTEDFTKGEEVRVLPCNHKFHPECVDPWLLNVSGTCPLCRIDLRPKGEDGEPIEPGVDGANPGDLPPPLEPGPSGARRDTVATLRGFATGTREERIGALRRLRDERRRRGVVAGEAGEVERRGVRERLRTRFRVRTTVGDEQPTRSASLG